MIEVKGKYNTATIYTDNIEQAAYSQVLNLMNQKFAEGSKFAIMPDCHAGAGCVIGLTMKVVDKVVPNLVGVDIGCGMLVVKVDRSFKFDLEKVDRIWHEDIPSGMNWRTKKHEFADRAKIEDIIAPVNVEKLKFSVGTLGGGNHFGEINVDDDGAHYIVIHSASPRHRGLPPLPEPSDKVPQGPEEIRPFCHRAVEKGGQAVRNRCRAEGIQERTAVHTGRPRVP